MNENLNWPPEYTVKKHPRARHVKLKTSMKNGLEIIVPLRFSNKYLPEILETNKAWIQKKLNEILEKQSKVSNESLPEQIQFDALGEIWQVRYIQGHSKKMQLLARSQKEIVLLGDINNKELAKKLLLAWTKEQAKQHLPVLLEKVSKQIQLPYKKVVIRAQKSRWGSCTSEKVINLNFKLLFLPSHLAIHILIHELCHTVHLNHSTKFWRLVASFDPDWKQHDRAIRKADNFMPGWLDAASS